MGKYTGTSVLGWTLLWWKSSYAHASFYSKSLDTFRILFYLPELLTHFFAILNWLETSEGCKHPEDTPDWARTEGQQTCVLFLALPLTLVLDALWTVQSASSSSLGSLGQILTRTRKLSSPKRCSFAWEFIGATYNLCKMFAHLWLSLCLEQNGASCLLCQLPAMGPWADCSTPLSFYVCVCKMG